MTINPQELEPHEMVREVLKAMRGAKNTTEAEELLRRHFCPDATLNVKERGHDYFDVLIKPHKNAEIMHIMCARFGFICPQAVMDHWHRGTSNIEECSDDTYVVVDNGLGGFEIYRGTTREECLLILRTN